MLSCGGAEQANTLSLYPDLTISYCIGQSAPLVGILWGTFFFKDFEFGFKG